MVSALKTPLVLVFAALLAACANLEVATLTPGPVLKDFAKPTIGVQSKASVGSVLFSQGTRIETEVFKLDAPYRTEWIRNSGHRAFPFVFDKGTILVQVGQLNGVPLFTGKSTGGMLQRGGGQVGAPYGIGVNEKDEVKYVFTSGDSEEIGAIQETPGRSVKAKRFIRVDADDRNLGKEIFFKSRTSDQFVFSYREYKNNWAKPIREQEISYRLDAGRSFEFKALRIQIIDATGDDITYVVKSGF